MNGWRTVVGVLLTTVIPFTTAQTNFSTPNFDAIFTAGSGVLRSLRTTIEPSFDFSPSDVFHLRNRPGQYHTGDLTFHYRTEGETSWKFADTAAQRPQSSGSSENGSNQITSSLNSALPHLNKGLKVSRKWHEVDGDLALSFVLQNEAAQSIELGSLGMPIEFNNIFTDRTAVETTQKCVLLDSYIGLNAGYAQVTRLTGTGPNLVITPLNQDSKFEAWNFLKEPEDVPLGYQIQTYEGNYAWQTHTFALADTDWKDSQPWNPPTSAILSPGHSITVGLRFSIAPTVHEIESVVSDVGLPHVVGIPGFVVPHDLTAKLFVHSECKITGITANPAGSLKAVPCGQYEGSQGYDVTADPSSFGRATLEITYSDSSVQSVHYWIANSSTKALSGLGEFLTTEQWFTNTSDPFGRAPSVMTYDREVDDVLLQDNRTWTAGLSDEGGAGSFLAAGMKQYVLPSADEVAKLEQMVEDLVWGRLQITSGNETYAVRKSLFYYEPELLPEYAYDPYFNWDASWDKEEAYSIDRTYDYVHVSALYWGLYRAGRTNPSILKHQTKEWYLLKAYNTAAYSVSNSSDGNPRTSYWNVGLMGETVWGLLLTDLFAEEYTAEAKHLESLMKARQQLWAGLPDPYGSEMAWDSTGEEGVYYWSRYFEDDVTADKTIRAIRGYMPTIPHWAWNGNARRYWDFLYAGDVKLARIERQGHHYGSGLNSLPLLDQYHRNPNPQSLQAIHDLRVGYGGNQGPLSNIDAGGFGSMAFHMYPDTLHWDAYSGDYGPNFLGHVIGAATYLVRHPVYGWVSFGGNIQTTCEGTLLTVHPRDAVRQKIFIAEVSLWIEIDAGRIDQFSFDSNSQEVLVNIVDNSKQQITLSWKQTVHRAQGPKMKLANEGMKHRLDRVAIDAPTTLKFVAT